MTAELAPAKVRLSDQLGPADEVQPMVERLRNAGLRGDDDADKAADEIDRLRLILAELVEAVEWSDGKRPHNLTRLGRAWWRAIWALGA